MALVLASQIIPALANNHTVIDLTKPVQEIKKELPQELSENILLTDVNYDIKKQTLTYSATALETQPEQINQNSIIDQVCYTPLLRNAIKENIIVSFFFYNESNTPLKHIVVTEALCQSNFKVFEEKLTEIFQRAKTSLLPMPINGELSLFNLGYESSQQAIIVDIKSTSEPLDTTHFNLEESIKIACTNDYLSIFKERNLNYIFNYYTAKGEKLIKTFNFGPNECKPKTITDISNPLDRKLAEDAQLMKKNLKAMSTDQIELVDVGYDAQKRIIWNKAVIKDKTISTRNIDPQRMIASLCTGESTRQTIDQGVSYSYHYDDSKNKPVLDFTVNKSTCQRYDNENNMLLQKNSL